VGYTELLTENQKSFETNKQGITEQGGTVNRNTSWSASGSYCLKMVNGLFSFDSATGVYLTSPLDTVELFAVTPGQEMQFSFYLKGATTVANVKCFTAAAHAYSDFESPLEDFTVTSIGPDVRLLSTGLFTIPSGAAYLCLYIWNAPGTSYADNFSFLSFSVEINHEVTDSIGAGDSFSKTYTDGIEREEAEPVGIVDSAIIAASYLRTVTDRIGMRDPKSGVDDAGSGTEALLKAYPFRGQGGHTPVRPVVIPRSRYSRKVR